jgi:hypothetical protein
MTDPRRTLVEAVNELVAEYALPSHLDYNRSIEFSLPSSVDLFGISSDRLLEDWQYP